jgi:CheY-like chemotaxis protein
MAKKVLIIDDSLFQRRNIRKSLQPCDYDIQEASTGREGLEMLTTFAPDCIILDILMPEIDGLGFLRILKAQGNTTPIIVLTADIQHSTSQECIELGATHIVHKPLSHTEAEKLRQMIHTLFESELDSERRPTHEHHSVSD